MAPFRGRRGGRGATRGRSSDKLARSGIRTKSGYRKFDSQRIKDVDEEVDEQLQSDAVEDEPDEVSESEEEDHVPAQNSYNSLLQSFQQIEASAGRPRKRRKIEVEQIASEDEVKDSSENDREDEDTAAEDLFAMDGEDVSDLNEELDMAESDSEDQTDPYESHFAKPNDDELARRVQDVAAGRWRTEKLPAPDHEVVVASSPERAIGGLTPISSVKSLDDLALKHRLSRSARGHIDALNGVQKLLAPHMNRYRDVLFGHRTPRNAESLRQLACLHAINHILKGRDKVLKNTARLNQQNKDSAELDVRDQGFTRPKILILLETRQMCFKYAETMVALFSPEQQENRKRFKEAFEGAADDRGDRAADFEELFEGNTDNNFLAALKFTRKTIKFYSAFYASDIIFASPLGLRRVLENDDVKKRDRDFLSSIEILIMDQADAMQMQNWRNVEIVMENLNCQLKEAHGCDFARVRPWYLDGNAKFLRQTIVFSAYITPEMNKIYKTHMQNCAGKVKFSSTYEGAIEASFTAVKQTFSRFDAISPATDPEARFKYFTSAVLPSLLRLPKPADGARGILVFIPSYFDFLRIRNFFATSTLTENISFGAIHDYSEVSEQRRARSHFLNGRHAILLYTQRAHHFFRLKIRGVKRVVLYGPPDNSVFYEELVGGFLGTSLNEGSISAEESGAKCVFSKWDGLQLERIVGSGRIKGMLTGKGDTFDFV